MGMGKQLDHKVSIQSAWVALFTIYSSPQRATSQNISEPLEAGTLNHSPQL